MKFNTLISIAVFSFVIAVSANASAGYMVNYQADPFISCDQCSDQPVRHYRHHSCRSYRHHYRHYRHHHYSKSRSHYSIQVYYTWNPYPDYSCGCGSCSGCCQQQGCRVARPRCPGTDYNDGFQSYPVHEYEPCQGGCNGARDYDTSTADDNYEY
jgi:hypothetical protein